MSSPESFLEKAANALDLPADVVAGVVRVEIIGTSELYVDNHKGILTLDENEIKLRAGANVLQITGERLRVISMTADEIRVGGKIQCVRFESLSEGDM